MNQKAIEEALLIAEAQSNLKHQAVIVHTLRDLCRRLKEADQVIEQRNAMLSAVWKPEAAPVQEPVANASAWFALVMNAAAELEDASHCLRDEDAKRAAISGAKHYRDAANALYTTPPAAQRQWVGLTADEQISAARKFRDAPVALVCAIEAKLKEKNT